MKLATLVAVATLAPALASAADFSGTWKLDNTFNDAVTAIYCTIVQEGDELSGNCRPDLPGMAAEKLTGTVRGSEAGWGYDLVFNGNGSPIKGEREPQAQKD